MRCSRCQHDNPPGTKFCGECAAPLASVCAACGAANPAENKFCGQCAAPLRAAADKLPSAQSYTPKHLAEKILTSRAALEGERKQVTVLFADLKGSMELLADRDPEEARKILDPVLERMMEAVHRYEGTVNQVMGDGIMALFGAPLAHEDHAVRACYAALRMQESVKKYAEGLRRSTGIPIQIRVGLNSGEVVVRSIGSDLHMDYTAVGQTTHLAARMEQMAKPESTLLTPDTLTLAEGFVQVHPLGAMAVKGLAAPIEVYELSGASAVRSRLQASAARGFTRFVGRDTEMEQLRLAMEQAGGGHGQLVAVVGEPGLGKSRLFHEFTHSHRTQGWLIAEASSVSYGQATSYLPVIDLLKGYFKITDRDPHREIRERVTGKLLTLDEGLRPILPAILALLGVPTENHQWTNLDPQQRRQRTLDAAKGLLLRESQVQPVLVVFEDLHWIDGETQALLDELVDSLPAARLLLLVNYRPEYSHGWGSKTYCTQLRLDALPAETASELLKSLLGSDSSVDPLKLLLAARTGGNPLFLEESVRSLVETGALAGERGAYHLTRSIEATQVPASVQAILAARIDRLSPEEKALLQAAAVIGKDVPFVLLREIVEEPEDRLRLRLSHLRAAEFLYETRLFPELEYTFKHALTHEVAYASLLSDRRRALHARIVTAIEAFYGGRTGEQAERLGDHAFRSEDWERAASYLRWAGAKAMANAAFRDAASQFGRALEALNHIPETGHTLEQRADLQFSLHDALLPLGAYDRIVDVVRNAEAIANTLNDRKRLGRAYSYLSHHAWIALADNERAAEYAHRALDIARAEANRPLEIVATFYLGQIGTTQGDLPMALEAFSRNISTLSATAELRPFEAFFAVNSRAWTAYPYSELGRFDEGLAVGQAGLRIAETTGNPIHLIAAWSGLGRLYAGRGDFENAISVLQRAMSMPMLREVPQRFGPLASELGSALCMAGRAAEGLGLLEDVQRIAGMIASHRALWLVELGEAYLGTKRNEDALAAAEQALMLSGRHRQRSFEARALRLLGNVHSHSDPAATEQAEACLLQALTNAAELGMRPLVGHCHLDLGALHRRTGKRDGALEHLTTAATMYREMDMRFWLEKVEAELKGLS